MRLLRFFTFLALLPLALVTACNRGAHPAQTGKLAPDFKVADGTTSVQLSKYRGKVVLVNFWATWCGPCVVELPSLIRLHHDQPDLVILGVSVDEDDDAYRSFIANRHVDFTTVRDPTESAAKLFHSEMWPETYVIDRNGYIRSKYVGATDWSDPAIRAFLKSL